MIQGHLGQRRQNVASSRPIANLPMALLLGDPPNPPAIAPIPAVHPPIPPPIVPPIPPIVEPRPFSRTHAMYTFCIPSTSQIFTDQTGRILIRSTSGNSNFIILYDFDSNYIHAETIPSRTRYQILLAYQRAHKLLSLPQPQTKTSKNR